MKRKSKLQDIYRLQPGETNYEYILRIVARTNKILEETSQILKESNKTIEETSKTILENTKAIGELALRLNAKGLLKQAPQVDDQTGCSTCGNRFDCLLRKLSQEMRNKMCIFSNRAIHYSPTLPQLEIPENVTGWEARLKDFLQSSMLEHLATDERNYKPFLSIDSEPLFHHLN